jgi:hypothetical protein
MPHEQLLATDRRLQKKHRKSPHGNARTWLVKLDVASILSVLHGIGKLTSK